MNTTRKFEYIPYMIVAVFVSFALMIGYMVVMAVRTNVNLVSSDYYKKELQFQQQIDASQRAHATDTPVELSFKNADQSLVVAFPATINPDALTGTIEFYRPSDANLDFIVPLATEMTTATQALQYVKTEKLAKGHWRVKLNWTYDGKAFFKETELTKK